MSPHGDPNQSRSVSFVRLCSEGADSARMKLFMCGAAVHHGGSAPVVLRAAADQPMRPMPAISSAFPSRDQCGSATRCPESRELKFYGSQFLPVSPAPAALEDESRSSPEPRPANDLARGRVRGLPFPPLIGSRAMLGVVAILHCACFAVPDVAWMQMLGRFSSRASAEFPAPRSRLACIRLGDRSATITRPDSRQCVAASFRPSQADAEPRQRACASPARRLSPSDPARNGRGRTGRTRAELAEGGARPFADEGDWRARVAGPRDSAARAGWAAGWRAISSYRASPVRPVPSRGGTQRCCERGARPRTRRSPTASRCPSASIGNQVDP